MLVCFFIMFNTDYFFSKMLGVDKWNPNRKGFLEVLFTETYHKNKIKYWLEVVALNVVIAIIALSLTLLATL